jgi:hypothetical protein
VSPQLLGNQPLLRAAQRFVLVIGAGALGAAVCATVILVAGTGPREAQRGIRTGGEVPAPPPRPLESGEAAAVALLRNATSAAAALPYRGKKLFASWTSSGGTSVLADVEHEPGRGTWVRVTSATGDDAPAPGGTLAEGGPDGPDPAALTALTSQYTVTMRDGEEYAGRSASVVELRREGWSGAAGRYWIDTRTGILLRHELYDARGHQVRVVAFLDLDLDLDLDVRDARSPSPVASSPDVIETAGRPNMFGPSGQNGRASAGDDVSAERLRQLRDQGWAVPSRLPGGLTLYCARELPGGVPTLQLTYSDGLFTASVFAQRGRLDPADLPEFAPAEVGGEHVLARAGLYRQLVWAGGDTVYTLVTDAPDGSVEQIVAALPHAPQPGGILSRVGRGIDRVGSWINPFE